MKPSPVFHLYITSFSVVAAVNYEFLKKKNLKNNNKIEKNTRYTVAICHHAIPVVVVVMPP